MILALCQNTNDGFRKVRKELFTGSDVNVTLLLILCVVLSFHICCAAMYSCVCVFNMVFARRTQSCRSSLVHFPKADKSYPIAAVSQNNGPQRSQVRISCCSCTNRQWEMIYHISLPVCTCLILFSSVLCTLCVIIIERWDSKLSKHQTNGLVAFASTTKYRSARSMVRELPR